MIMIRLLIALIGGFLIWVLFFSSFSKQKKIVIAVLAVLISALGLGYEIISQQPVKGAMALTSVEACGVHAKHTYRTNFDLNICVNNVAEQGDITRIGFSIIASYCEEPNSCVEVERVRRDLNVELRASDNLVIEQNLAFNELDPELDGIIWALDIHSLEAVK